jgi:hypothetical protein
MNQQWVPLRMESRILRAESDGLGKGGHSIQEDVLYKKTRACIQNKEMRDRVYSMNRLFLPVFIYPAWRIGDRYTDFLRVDSLF